MMAQQHNKSKSKIVLFSVLSVVDLLIFIGLSTALYFTIVQTMDKSNHCLIEEYTYSNCFESNGRLYLEQYYNMTMNRTGFIRCGHVSDCLTNPCSINITTGTYYGCKLFSENLYLLSSRFGNNVPFIYVSIILCCLLIVSIIVFILFIRRIHTYNTTQIYYKINDRDLEDSL